MADRPYQYGMPLIEALATVASEGDFEAVCYIQAELGTFVAQPGNGPAWTVSRETCDRITARFPDVYMYKMREWISPKGEDA